MKLCIKNYTMYFRKIAFFTLFIGAIGLFGSCTQYQINKFSDREAYNSFNMYKNQKKYKKDYHKYYAKDSDTRRKRVTPRYYQDQVCLTFLRKQPKKPQNSVVRIYYPYQFVFLFLGRYWF